MVGIFTVEKAVLFSPVLELYTDFRNWPSVEGRVGKSSAVVGIVMLAQIKVLAPPPLGITLFKKYPSFVMSGTSWLPLGTVPHSRLVRPPNTTDFKYSPLPTILGNNFMNSHDKLSVEPSLLLLKK